MRARRSSSKLQKLDRLYFSQKPWAERLEAWLRKHASARTFIGADAQAVEVISKRRDLGLRMSVNIPPHALLLFFNDGRYKNGYELKPRAGSGEGGPSATRRRVDAALFPGSDRPPAKHYFGAVVLGGSGVRYYGEYCVVLKETQKVIPDDTQVLDRNSYDAIFAPLAGLEPLDKIMERLRGRWGRDLVPMVKLKILPELGAAPRLTTAATASETLLHDESFVEVHKYGTFRPGDVHEVRESAADAAVETDLVRRRARGQPHVPEESIWLARRHRVDQALAAYGIKARIIVTTGRTPR
jgi:hypothetical protein